MPGFPFKSLRSCFEFSLSLAANISATAAAKPPLSGRPKADANEELDIDRETFRGNPMIESLVFA
jgi:hypothetical protein